MLRTAQSLQQCRLKTYDGKRGRLRDLYFDDETWQVRHAVVSVDGFADREALLPPAALGEPDWFRREMPLLRTVEQVAAAPESSSVKPSGSEDAPALPVEYFAAVYQEPCFSVPLAGVAWRTAGVETGTSEWEDSAPPCPHIWSLRKLRGYSIEAPDGAAGRLKDFVVEDSTWGLSLMIVRVGRWFFGRDIRVATPCVDRMDSKHRRLHVRLQKAFVEGASTFNAGEPVNRKTEIRLYDYLGRPV